jgi:hypothetical protein
MTTELINFEEFKVRCAEFFRSTQDRSALSMDEIENGQKMIGLSYLRLDTNTSELDLYQASLLLNMATRRETECALARFK